MPADYFDDRIARSYDEDVADMFDQGLLDATVDALALLAAGGPALELGIGTGRVAVPLARQGVSVHGIDLSEAMVRQLRSKPGSDAISVTLGDFATVRVGGTFRLAYLVFNTISNLTTQEEQVHCFLNVADHLEEGGRFLVEVGVPELQRLPPGETFVPSEVSSRHVCIDEIDVATQSLRSHHYFVRDDAVEHHSIPFRYVWPSELDLMARLAGMTLVDRWADWDREPFTSVSRKHISVWRKGA